MGALWPQDLAERTGCSPKAARCSLRPGRVSPARTRRSAPVGRRSAQWVCGTGVREPGTASGRCARSGTGSARRPRLCMPARGSRRGVASPRCTSRPSIRPGRGRRGFGTAHPRPLERYTSGRTPQQREAVVEVRLQYEEVDIPIPRPGQVEWTREDAVEQIRRIDRGVLEERGGLRSADEVAEAVHHSGGVAGFEELVEDPREISRHDVRGHERMRQLREGDLRGGGVALEAPLVVAHVRMRSPDQARELIHRWPVRRRVCAAAPDGELSPSASCPTSTGRVYARGPSAVRPRGSRER